MTITTSISRAAERIYCLARSTPLDYSAWYSTRTSCHVYFKLENLQYTGSFKLRGTTNKLLSLTDEQREKGCITASSGNHGAATAYAMSKLGVNGTIFLPESTNPSKVEAIRSCGGIIEYYGQDGGDTETHARSYAEEHGQVYISPYNDPEVVAGQGTIAVEMQNQLDQIDVIYVAVGGGGLISGIAGFIKSVNPECKVIGCLPENSPVMAESIKAGQVVDCDNKPTLSDGTAGNMDADSITFALCQQYVDSYVLVSEQEIATAMRDYIEHQHMLLEGAAGVAIAGFLKTCEDYHDKNVVIVICGQNIDLQTLKQVI